MYKRQDEVYGYDKVIMLAGGVGYGTQRDCLKGTPEEVAKCAASYTGQFLQEKLHPSLP